MTTVAIVGLGYVGLPLAAAFGAKLRTIGYDSNPEKIGNYRKYCDPTGEVSEQQLRDARYLELTDDPKALGDADFIIVAVPTPVDTANRPDFSPLVGASRVVGPHIKRGATVVYESTVYPGATEEICVPVLEECSGMKWPVDFHVAYSPERVNPGDKHHTLQTIVKLVAGDDAGTLEATAQLYEQVVTAGVYRASSIRVAEAAKVIENTQRDLNIALVNELAVIFHKLGLDTVEVLEAAGTKWNFLPFRPGFVGGHCIGVDPYYLTFKAQMVGYHPQVILAGRQINDDMGKFVAAKTVKQMIKAGDQIRDAKVNVLGLTFKENCPDLRNSLVASLVRELESFGIEVFVHDPLADPEEAEEEYGIKLWTWNELPRADAIVAAVAHRGFIEKPIADYAPKVRDGGCFIDVKSAFNREELRARGLVVWRL